MSNQEILDLIKVNVNYWIKQSFEKSLSNYMFRNKSRNLWATKWKKKKWRGWLPQLTQLESCKAGTEIQMLKKKSDINSHNDKLKYVMRIQIFPKVTINKMTFCHIQEPDMEVLFHDHERISVDSQGILFSARRSWVRKREKEDKREKRNSWQLYQTIKLLVIELQ